MLFLQARVPLPVSHSSYSSCFKTQFHSLSLTKPFPSPIRIKGVQARGRRVGEKKTEIIEEEEKNAPPEEL